MNQCQRCGTTDQKELTYPAPYGGWYCTECYETHIDKQASAEYLAELDAIERRSAERFGCW